MYSITSLIHTCLIGNSPYYVVIVVHQCHRLRWATRPLGDCDHKRIGVIYHRCVLDKCSAHPRTTSGYKTVKYIVCGFSCDASRSPLQRTNLKHANKALYGSNTASIILDITDNREMEWQRNSVTLFCHNVLYSPHVFGTVRRLTKKSEV